MESQGTLDERDLNIHKHENDAKSMNAYNSFGGKSDDSSNLAGKECWLQFAVFDVVYVDGPDAASFLSIVVAEHVQPRPSPGFIIDLDGFERKKILYALIKPQENEVEIIKTWVIRPNGRSELGEYYFVPAKLPDECGYPVALVDSQHWSLGKSCSIDTLRDIDLERRRGRSDEQIGEARAHAIQTLYDVMVEQQRLEGLLFKDLSAPYVLGETSKSLKYWLKFKPDYFDGSAASDIDLVVIGGYFATGLQKAGRPSGLLCACVDSKDADLFYPLVKVNAGSTNMTQYNELLNATGYSIGREGKESDGEDTWFRLNKEMKEMPNFVSTRSPHSNEKAEWRVQKKDCEYNRIRSQ
jgi:hypothetical protein